MYDATREFGIMFGMWHTRSFVNLARGVSEFGTVMSTFFEQLERLAGTLSTVEDMLEPSNIKTESRCVTNGSADRHHDWQTLPLA